MTSFLLRNRRSFLWVLLSIGMLFTLIPAAHAQRITATAQAAPVNALSVNDVDFINSTTPKWLFTIDVTTGRPTPVSVALHIWANVTLSNGESFPNAVDMLTKAFVVVGSRTVTNLDFARSGSIRDSSYKFDSYAKQRFEQVALPTGMMPTGTYIFNVVPIEVATKTQGDPSGFHYDLSNPTAVELVFPFDGDQNVSELPLFQWKFDGTRSKISIYEKLPSQGSLEDAASGVPFFSTEVPTSSLQYPSSGVRALQAGKTYVWYVEGRFTSAGGNDVVLKSPLRSFTVASTISAGATSSSILDDLERSLDPKFKSVFDQIRAEGLSATGTIRLNGTPVSTGELLRIFNQLRNHGDDVVNVTIE